MTQFSELVKKRRSIRDFSDEPLSDSDVVLLMRAALMSPTSKSTRAWEFVLVDDKDLLHQLSECKPYGAQMIARAPLAVVVTIDPLKSDVWIEDAAVASTCILLQAEDLGLGACWVQIRNRTQDDGTLSSDWVKEILGIPTNLEVVSVIAVGHKASVKKPQNENALLWERIHLNGYGQ